ncbi:MAG: glycoside hydrolase family 3 N-terminal domain-containing protein, partial [Candidatus Sulfotelmatobacter sp.]
MLKDATRLNGGGAQFEKRFVSGAFAVSCFVDAGHPPEENEGVFTKASGVLLLILLACSASGGDTPKQPVLGHRSVPLLTVDGLTFKDLNRNGKLDPYEDWRLPAEARTADLVQKMSLEELAGLMVHGTLPSIGPLGAIGVGDGYDLAKTRQMIDESHVNNFITRLNRSAEAFAKQNNEVQAIAESSRWGIPVTISTDPRNHFDQVLGAGTQTKAFSMWPAPLGFAALNDAELTRRFGDVVRREYEAVGIRESLAPQADLATEPRWARINGTFGEDAEIAKRMVEAYVTGIQNGPNGLNSGSVTAVVKHWAGYGAAKDGWDSHNYYGRYAEFSGNNFAQHLIPFTGAFASHVGSVMPTYSILQNLTLDGKPVEQVGAGFNHQLLTDLLRNKYGFSGVILSDWAITNDCPATCRNGASAGTKPAVSDIGMPWGVEELTVAQRFAKAINAGVDQIGGTERSSAIVEDVHNGTIPEARVRQAASRILLQKFQLGLFEQPYVDETQAAVVAGNKEFVKEGEAAQARAVVLLENKPAASTGKPLLPASGKKIYLFGVAANAAQAAGFTVVTDPAQADFALVRAPAPYQSEHPNYFFGSRQHEGRLAYVETDPAYVELLRVSAIIPTVFVTTLERPLILTNVRPHVTALLGDFGISDEALLALVSGKASPQGRLPFELPSSIEAVQQQKSDLPHDSQSPLYPIGFGL